MRKKKALHISALGSRVTSIVSVSLVLVLMGLTALMTCAARKATDNVRRNMGFTVKMEQGTGQADVNAMKTILSRARYVDSFVYTGPEEILAQESEIIGEDIMELVDENPYGAEFDVRLRADWADADSIRAISTVLARQKGVEDVLSDTGIIDSVNRNLRHLSLIMLAVAGALLIISFVLINNTVSLAVYSRRFVIHTMRLVGATAAFIRRPFLSAGAVTGLIAAAVASAILAGIQAYATQADPRLASAFSWADSAAVYALLAVAGVLICLLASAIATNRYLRHDIDDYYMN